MKKILVFLTILNTFLSLSSIKQVKDDKNNKTGEKRKKKAQQKQRKRCINQQLENKKNQGLINQQLQNAILKICKIIQAKYPEINSSEKIKKPSERLLTLNISGTTITQRGKSISPTTLKSNIIHLLCGIFAKYEQGELEKKIKEYNQNIQEINKYTAILNDQQKELINMIVRKNAINQFDENLPYDQIEEDEEDKIKIQCQIKAINEISLELSTLKKSNISIYDIINYRYSSFYAMIQDIFKLPELAILPEKQKISPECKIGTDFEKFLSDSKKQLIEIFIFDDKKKLIEIFIADFFQHENIPLNENAITKLYSLCDDNLTLSADPEEIHNQLWFLYYGCHDEELE